MSKKKSFFAEQLKKIMYEKHITQKELAKKLGVVQQRVSSWVTGEYNPTVASIKKISYALQVPFDYFIEKMEYYNDKHEINEKDIKILELEKQVLTLENKILKFEKENSELKLENETLKNINK